MMGAAVDPEGAALDERNPHSPMKRTDSVKWEVVYKWLIVVNKVEAEQFVEGTKTAMRDTAEEPAFVEGRQSEEVIRFELGFIIGQGSGSA
jgi:hypothetical protein